ncbi:MAG TPA: hypothetical protein VGL53_24470 [Bryobacteraceae bacterium]|jgi:hypothetical protein
MSKPVTLLERLCEHVLSLGATSIEVEREGRREYVYAVFGNQGGLGIDVINFAAASRDARELHANLEAAALKPLRTVLGGKVYLLGARIDERPFEVTIERAPFPDPDAKPAFTDKQGQYLAFIHAYSRIHGQAPSEAELERHFRVSAPTIHEMIKLLERNSLIEKTPGKARSIRLLVRPEHLPPLR